MRVRHFVLAAAAAMAPAASLALQVSSFSPQGEVASVRQVVARFDAPAVRVGDPKAGAPLAIRCSDAAASRGSGRWTSEREWVFDFAEQLPPGVRCSAEPVSSFKSASGADWTVTKSYTFNSGGPVVVQVRPGTWQALDEEQFFVLQLSGPATLASVQASAWCSLEGVGERIPVRLVGGAERSEVLKALQLERQAAKEPLAIATLACNRRLTPGSQLQLVVGKGLATPSGVVSKVGQRYGYTVRPAFTAELGCERENAQAACLPIRPMALRFSAPVPWKMASALRLRGPQGVLKPLPEGEDEAKAADGHALVSAVRFAAPFAQSSRYVLELPKDFADASGRPLANAAMFPLAVATGAMPPLAKFAAAPFGIVERFAEGPGGPALLPITLRKVEPALRLQALGPAPGAVPMQQLSPQSDADIIAWYRRVQYYDRAEVARKLARRDARAALPQPLKDGDPHYVQSRMVALLAGQRGVRSVALPQGDGADPRPFEVLGVPLAPGFHVLEVASPLLGAALLAPEYGTQRTMFVRTSALVTNLAVHFKLGRENALAWVTTLDQGKVVAGAQVQVSGCDGRVLAQALTDAQGRAPIEGLPASAPRCDEGGDGYGGADGYFVSVRHTGADGVADLAFTWSEWQRGIEPWRFNVPTSAEAERDQRAHTVFDRTLLRAGETVSMKHFLRDETAAGFALARTEPTQLTITHVGSGQEFVQPLAWRASATGGRSAESEFAVPPAAKLGAYSVELRRTGERSHSLVSGQFRVEAFRLPVLQGRVGPVEQGALVNLRQLPVDVQLHYVAGGPAARLPVRVSALVRGKHLSFPDYEDFSFGPPRERGAQGPGGGEEGGGDEAPGPAASDARIIADKRPLTLDAQGSGRLQLEPVPRAASAQELLVEASYADPSGEVQTLRSSSTLWPAAVVAGLKTEGWASSGSKARFQVLALSPAGKPLAGVRLQVQARVHTTTSSRKRIVGGFYSYDHHTETHDLGTLCTGKSDARGLLACQAQLDDVGEIELVATARDQAGNSASAASSLWVGRAGEQWFGGENHDRIDVLPERRAYEPGETARLQVRMPFREATALVAVEREGILETQVVRLSGKDPSIALKVQPGWGPNVYVSVLALRGRLHEVPWYSFFTWGYQAPRAWWGAFWHDGRQYRLPSALVDLSKPAFRFGMAEIKVGAAAHRIGVTVAADKASYPVRGKAELTITATLPGGKPAAHAEVAVAAVDEALLELMPNTSWDLLSAMLQRRAWGVQTATAQMEIIGRRHYGKKAAPPGGGGGRAPTRELLDTLLLWQPAVALDAQGQARVTVPLNDALTRFRIVAVADAGVGLFGTGSTTIAATQDLQIVSGLPPLVREGDQFRAQLTLRNTTQQAMKVEVAPRATLLDLKAQTIALPAGAARELAWNVTAPAQLAQTRVQAILWEIEAKDTLGGARDALKARQRLIPAVPLTVQQAALVQVDGSVQVDVNPPADALPGRGGLKLALQPSLAGGLPGVRDWWARYPFACLEQQASKAIGLRDPQLWQTVVAQLPTYLDGDGLAHYFPPQGGAADRGSDALTAYLLAATHEAASLNPAFALPDALRAPMERGLIAFVEGRIERSFWSPRTGKGGDLDMRKLAAIEALSRYGKARGRMLASVTVAPNQWPTHSVIDWLNILRRVQDVPQREQRLAEATQILKSRLSYQGTKLIFSTERDDYWWWLMQNGDVNTARLVLATLDDPAWKDDMGRLASGFIARQQGGAWHTTTANLWGGLALEKFSAKFEATPVAGATRASMGTGSASVDWSKVAPITERDASGAAHQGTWFGAPAAPGMLRGNSLFLPWGAGKEQLSVVHQGPGKPWLTLQSVAAIERKAPFNAGYRIEKTVTPVEQAHKDLAPGQYTRGDVLRVQLTVTSQADMTWVAITDPIPGGATILGSGLGRDSEIATQGEKRSGAGWPAFEERSFEAFRSYYAYLPKGTVTMEYTVRLNNVGDFALPPSRAEALYAPEMFGEAPNTRVRVQAPPAPGA